MLIDGNRVDAAASLRADVVIVGAGPAGISLAEELDAAGLRVIVVEAAGREHKRADDDGLTGVSTADPFPLVTSRRRGFGGTSGHWTPTTGLRVRPFDDVDFENQTWRAGHSWPFGRSELEPYYERAHRTIGLAGGYEPRRWFGDTAPTPLAWAGGPQLAVFQFADHDCFVRRFDAFAASPRIDLVLHATVAEIVVGTDGKTITRLSVVAPSGTSFSVEATTYVLAAGGIDNARLLLASPGPNGHGVGNEHDNVGRYFMDHLSVDSGVIVPAQALDATVFGQRDTAQGRIQPMLWLGDERIVAEGIPNAAFWIDHQDPAYQSPGVGAARSWRTARRAVPRVNTRRHALAALRGAPDLITYASNRGRSRQRVLGLRIMVEQVPDRASRVVLGSRRDVLGMPRVELRWRVASSDLDTIAAHQEVLRRMLSDHGVGDLGSPFDAETHRSPIMTNAHHMGTTRMHIDPRHGVVDPYGLVYSTSNLYVVGSSVFPTGSYLNPTLTILALALRTGDAIRRRHAPTMLSATGGAAQTVGDPAWSNASASRSPAAG